LPSARLEFALRGSVAYESFYKQRDEVEEVYRGLLYEADAVWERNAVAVKAMHRAYRIASTALGVEIVALALLATGTIL
jgi:hypothetical protein